MVWTQFYFFLGSHGTADRGRPANAGQHEMVRSSSEGGAKSGGANALEEGGCGAWRQSGRRRGFERRRRLAGNCCSVRAGSLAVDRVDVVWARRRKSVR